MNNVNQLFEIYEESDVKGLAEALKNRQFSCKEVEEFMNSLYEVNSDHDRLPEVESLYICHFYYPEAYISPNLLASARFSFPHCGL